MEPQCGPALSRIKHPHPADHWHSRPFAPQVPLLVPAKLGTAEERLDSRGRVDYLPPLMGEPSFSDDLQALDTATLKGRLSELRRYL